MLPPHGRRCVSPHGMLRMLVSRKLLHNLAAAVLLLQSGGLTLTGDETGRTLGKGVSQLALSATAGTYCYASLGSPEDNRLKDTDDCFPADYLPVVQLGFKVGALPRTDVGLDINTTTFTTLRVKQQLLGSSTSLVAGAVGLEGGFNPAAAVVGGLGYMYWSVPLYVSVHPSERLALFVTPRYGGTRVAQWGVVPGGTKTDNAMWSYAAVSYGAWVRVAEDRYLVAEIAHLGRDTRSPTQLSLGLRVRLPQPW